MTLSSFWILILMAIADSLMGIKNHRRRGFEKAIRGVELEC